MFNTTLEYLNKFTALWSGGKAFSDAVADLRASIEEIGRKVAQQEAPLAGVSGDRDAVRDELEDKTFEVAEQVAALASLTGNELLAAEVEITRSALDKLSAERLEDVAQRIRKTAAAHLSALADYQITQSDLDELDSLIKTFQPLKAATRTAISNRAGITTTLPDAIRTTTSILRDRLDRLIVKHQKNHPEFVAGYRSARVVVDRGGATATANQPTPTPVS